MEDQPNKEEREERGHKQIRDQTFSLFNTILYMYFFLSTSVEFVTVYELSLS